MATEIMVLCKERVAAPKHQMWCECGAMHERVGNSGAATQRAGSPPRAASGADCGLQHGPGAETFGVQAKRRSAGTAGD